MIFENKKVLIGLLIFILVVILVLIGVLFAQIANKKLPSNDLGSYVTKSDLTSDLAGYAKTSDISDYVTKSINRAHNCVTTRKATEADATKDKWTWKQSGKVIPGDNPNNWGYYVDRKGGVSCKSIPQQIGMDSHNLWCYTDDTLRDKDDYAWPPYDGNKAAAWGYCKGAPAPPPAPPPAP